VEVVTVKEITIRLDDDTFLKLWATARRHGLSVEEIARRSIDYALNQLYDPNADPANDPTVKNLLRMLLPVLEGEREG
jgi:plasmid stability protein